MHNILIVGSGQLGSRYLQGLSKVSIPLNIIVLDVCTQSLMTAFTRWQEVVKIDTPHIASQPKTKSPTVAATPHSRVRGASLSSTSSQVNHIEEVKTQQSTVTFLPIPINTSGNTAQAPSPGVQVIPARLPVTYGF